MHRQTHLPWDMRQRPVLGLCLPRFGRQPRKAGVGGLAGHLREGKGHQSPTDHYEVQDVPEVAEVGTLVQHEAQVDHLCGERLGWFLSLQTPIPPQPPLTWPGLLPWDPSLYPHPQIHPLSP